MRSVWSVFKILARATVWRPTPEPRLVGLTSLFAWTIAVAALRVWFQFVAAGPDAAFNPYGLNAVIAWLALQVAVAALFVPAAARVTALSAMFALLLVAELVIETVTLAVARLPPPAVATAIPWLGRIVPIALFALVAVWWIGAMMAVLRSFAPQPKRTALARVAALWVALLVVSVLMPHAPVFVARDFDIRSANLWEYLLARYLPRGESTASRGEAAQFEQSQRSLLDAEVARLAPPKKGATNVYAIGIAGWAGQDVFIKELDGGLAAIGAVLPIRDHALRLVNHRETLESLPLANQRNFATAVHAVGELMDKNEDVLLLLMTSHGVPSGFALQLPNEVTSELTPQQVAGALDKEGIKNRVVIVSACFAGAFVPPLANDDTIVLTAADAKSTSFGCAPERDWTYFGDALFRQSLRPGRDLQHAFDNARVLIQGWELMDHAQPSNPQGHFGPALVARLAPVLSGTANAGQ